MPKVGVVAVQGDFAKHIEALLRLGLTVDQIAEVRGSEDLADVDRVIIPGGESTTVGLLMQRYGLGDALRTAAEGGMPVWGTCMGMILMAHAVEDREQYTLDLLDITVRRNAFGSQVNSFEDDLQLEGIEDSVTGVFIRSPVVTSWGKAVPIARYQSQVVAVRQGRRLGTSFHPELTEDTRVHRYFLEM